VGLGAVALGSCVLFAFESAGFDKFDHLFDRQVFGPEIWGEVERFENFVDLGFGYKILHGGEDFAAQEFSSMKEHCSEASVEEFKVDDPGAFLRVGDQTNDR
jgi:hypothetical protein